MKASLTIHVRALLILMLSALAAPQALAAEATSAETKARMIQLIDKLEHDPFTADGGEIRGEVMSWLTEAPDITVNVCAHVLGDTGKLEGDDGKILVVQLIFSQAKFMLEHPDEATDQRAISIAGVKGVLQTYAAMKAARPKLSIREIERLVKLQSSGELNRAVDAGLAECG